MSSTARVFQNRLFVHVAYTPQILENLFPNVHFFAGIFNIKIDKLKREIKSVNSIEEVEPPGYTWNGTQISFDTGGFQQENILCQDKTVPDDEPKNFMLEKNAVCRNCADKGQLYFCDVTDRNCINVEQFKDRVLNSDLKNIKCTVKILQNEKQCTVEDNIVWPYFSGSSS